MFQDTTVANSSIFHTTSQLIPNLLKFTALNADQITGLKTTAQAILKRLKFCELGILLTALESRGGDVSGCVYYQCGETVNKHIVHEPEVVLYRTFRQPCVQSSLELKPLAVCSRRDASNKKVCINPHHYSALVRIETETTSIRAGIEKRASKADESSGFGSSCTQSTFCDSMDQTLSHIPLSKTEKYLKPKEWPKRSWCCVAYWEHHERIGPLYHENQDILNIYEALPMASSKGLCLADLDRSSNVPAVIKRVRNHIGFGFQLSREEDGIWMYNRSAYSLFANGPTLSGRSSGMMCRHNILVHKVPPGYSLKLYDYTTSPRTCKSYGHDVLHPVPQSVRVSFAKGWGNTTSSTYCRQFVTSCPCWVEVHFV